MFTGIVEEMGTVKECNRQGQGFDLCIHCSTVLEGTALGDSICVNGVCLTVAKMDGSSFTAGLAPETRSRTNLEALTSGSPVNLERSVTPTTRMGGHFVQGHVDTVGVIKTFKKDEDALWVTISADDSVMRYIVTKGYVTLDGTSLTVVDVQDDWFNVTLVSYTQSHIIMPTKAVGDKVNIEVDVLGKYVERLLQFNNVASPGSAITPQFLSEHGYE
ncbi:MAG: riboflavin synthase [Gammaproteobacteria bacterium]|nr:riboflavin synthase [Gammaproteobacteria bacterium]